MKCLRALQSYTDQEKTEGSRRIYRDYERDQQAKAIRGILGPGNTGWGPRLNGVRANHRQSLVLGGFGLGLSCFLLFFNTE